MRRLLVAFAVLLAAFSGQSFASGTKGFGTESCAYPANKPWPGSGAVRNVPADYATIQAAVNAAVEGDTILIAPGVYEESVLVTTPGLRIRGADRNGTILDGRMRDGSGNYIVEGGFVKSRKIGLALRADRILVENLTVRYYSEHGVHWQYVVGYWGRYLTAHNIAAYGVFAYGSRCGQFDHSLAMSSGDAGYYIGECYPCDAVIHDVIATENALGYSGTNAGGNLTLRDSVWHNNAMGIVPNSLDGEERPPQRGMTIARNSITNNNNRTAPGVPGVAGTFWGVGIALAGVQANSVYGNVVRDHSIAGVVIAPLPSRNVWIPSGNTIWGNTVTHDPDLYPESLDLAQGAVSGSNNCWADNVFGTSAPAAIQDVWSCAMTTTPPGGDPRVEIGLAQGEMGMNGRVRSPWQTWPEPATPQPTQPSSQAGPLTYWLPALGV